MLHWLCYKKPEYNINSVIPLYLVIGEIDGFIEEKDGSKYLNIALTDSKNEVLKKYAETWRGIKDQILKMTGSVGEYDKDHMKIKFDSDDNLPLNTVIRFIFEKDSKYYPQIFLDDSLFEL